METGAGGLVPRFESGRPDCLQEPRISANAGERPRKRCASREGIRSCSRLCVGLETANGPQRARKGTANGPQPSWCAASGLLRERRCRRRALECLLVEVPPGSFPLQPRTRLAARSKATRPPSGSRAPVRVESDWSAYMASRAERASVLCTRAARRPWRWRPESLEQPRDLTRRILSRFFDALVRPGYDPLEG